MEDDNYLKENEKKKKDGSTPFGWFCTIVFWAFFLYLLINSLIVLYGK